MNRYLSLLLPFFLRFTNGVHAQQTRIDSLWQAAATAKNEALKSEAYSLLADHMNNTRNYEAEDSERLKELLYA